MTSRFDVLTSWQMGLCGFIGGHALGVNGFILERHRTAFYVIGLSILVLLTLGVLYEGISERRGDARA